jgi:hypothetical protein
LDRIRLTFQSPLPTRVPALLPTHPLTRFPHQLPRPLAYPQYRLLGLGLEERESQRRLSSFDGNHCSLLDFRILASALLGPCESECVIVLEAK